MVSSTLSQLEILAVSLKSFLERQNLILLLYFVLVVQSVPTMGDSISEGVIESYVKSKFRSIVTLNDAYLPLSLFLLNVDPGEYVEADEIVARIETDKVTVDILSEHAGVITKYFAEEGDVVEVGAEFFEIDTDAKAPEGGAAAATPATPEPAVSDISKCAPSKFNYNYLLGSVGRSHSYSCCP